MTYLSCPLCSTSVPSVSLELHLRSELSYTPLRCLLCPLRFFLLKDALRHFRGPFADHPREEVALAQAPDEAKEERLRELLRSARGAEQCTRACGCCVRLRLCSCREAKVDGGAAEEATEGDWRVEEQPQFYGRAEMDPLSSEVEEASPPQAPPTPQPLASSTCVKPEPSEEPERKPIVSNDGKVSCTLCGYRVARNNFSNHAQRNHVSASPFYCNLCPYKAKQKHCVQTHLRLHHKAAADSDSMTVMDLRKDIADKVAECFGDAQDADLSVLCRSCKASVPAQQKRLHTAQRHLRKALHSCRLCPFTSMAVGTAQIKHHLKAQHGQHMTEENTVSDVDKYAPVIKRMMTDLFEA